jgi:hypothetical protein
MHRILFAVALAVLALAGTSAPARANQKLTFSIAGAGTVTSGPAGGLVVNCTRAPADTAASGDCDEQVNDGAFVCDDPTDPSTCHTEPGTLTFRAVPAAGYTFTGWSHPQCVPATLNPCGVSVVIGNQPTPGNPPWPPLNVTATFVDTTPPTAGLTSPTDGAAVRGTIPLRASASDNGVLTLVFRVRGNPLPQTFEVPPFALDLDTTQLADGAAAISATATDGAGQSAASAVNVTIDNHNPTLTVTGPDGQTFGPGTVPTWTIAAADATTAVSVRCSVVPAGQPASFGGCSSATQERLPNQPDGRYTLTVQAMDAAGNAVQQSKAFAIDTGPPETTITSGPADGASMTATALTWGFAASEPSTFECRLFLSAVTPGAFGPCTTGASHSVAGLAPGSYTFEVRATDAFTNVDPTPARRTVTVTLPPPPPPTPSPPAPSPPPRSPAPPRPRVLQATLTFAFAGAPGRTTQLTRLVMDVPRGTTVTAVCPKGCARRTLVVRKAHGKVSLKRLTGAAPLPANTKITVTVAKPGAVSAVKVFEIRQGRAPTVRSLCQPPGAKKPHRCT